MWWLLLLLGGAAIIGTAKNVRGETVKGGERSMRVDLLDSKGSPAAEVLIVSPTQGKWQWLVPNWGDIDAPYAMGIQGKEPTRKQAFNAGLTAAMSAGAEQLGTEINPGSAGLQIDFLNHDADVSDIGWGEGLIFRASIIPTSGGWLTQITDPSATVKFFKTLKSRNAAIHEAYKFVEKAGY